MFCVRMRLQREAIKLFSFSGVYYYIGGARYKVVSATNQTKICR